MFCGSSSSAVMAVMERDPWRYVDMSAAVFTAPNACTKHADANSLKAAASSRVQQQMVLLMVVVPVAT